jgi:hypothetical protein
MLALQNVLYELNFFRPPIIRVSDKVMIPQDDHPDINFVGLLIGPRGNTLKCEFCFIFLFRNFVVKIGMRNFLKMCLLLERKGCIQIITKRNCRYSKSQLLNDDWEVLCSLMLDTKFYTHSRPRPKP